MTKKDNFTIIALLKIALLGRKCGGKFVEVMPSRHKMRHTQKYTHVGNKSNGFGNGLYHHIYPLSFEHMKPTIMKAE